MRNFDAHRQEYTRFHLEDVMFRVYIDATNEPASNAFESLIGGIIKAEGLSFFRVENRTNQFIVLNPDYLKWHARRTGPLTNDDLAAYYTERFYDQESRSTFYTGVTFNFVRTNLQVLPNWPLPYWYTNQVR